MQKRTVLHLLLGLSVLPVALAVASARVAAADDGLTVASTYTYTVDPDTNLVHVLADMRFTNVLPDTTSGNIISRAYFKSFSLPLLDDAINTVATQNSHRLTLTPTPTDDSALFFQLRINFAANLYYRETAHVLVTYDLTGQPPRTEKAPTRVNAAYVAFDAYGIADSGRLTVRIVVPSAYTVDKLGSDVVQTEENGNTIYTAAAIERPNDFDIFVSARNDSALESSNITTAGHEFVLRSWPGDADWKAFSAQQITVGVPILNELIGQPWPITGSIDVREAFTPYLYGYAGWFNPIERKLEMGEDLDAQVMLHELSHAWFNTAMFNARWINEGLAQEYSGLANEKLGLAAVSPKEVVAGDAGAVKLNEWGDPALATVANETETYGYNASWFVLKHIVDAVGVDKMRDIFAAARDKTISYVGNGPAETYDTSADWRRLLDLADQVGAPETIDDLFRTYVLTPSELEQMTARSTARADYSNLTSDSLHWAPPLAIRKAMARWSFPEAESMITNARAVLEKRDELVRSIKPLGIAIPPSLQTAYESAEVDLNDVRVRVFDQAGAAKELANAAAAQEAHRGLFNSVGLMGTHVTADLADATTAFEKGDTATTRTKIGAVLAAVNASHDVGRNRILLAALALLGLIVLAVVITRRVRRRRQAAASVP